MKHFEIYSQWGMTKINAERIERHSFNDKPSKILFMIGDEIVAEFYCDQIAGWVERESDA